MITITFARKKSGSHFPLQLVVIARVSSFTSKEEKKKNTKTEMEESSRSLPPCSVASAACVNACQDAPRLRVFTIHALLVISISSSSSFKVRLLGARRSAASGNRIRKQ